MKYIHDKASEHVQWFIQDGESLKGGRGLVIPISKDFSPGAHEVKRYTPGPIFLGRSGRLPKHE
jgi:hypothetical protein